MNTREIVVQGPGVRLDGTLDRPDGAVGLVLFAHGSGSSRFSPRNRAVAGALQRAGLATLLIDLLTREEEEEERFTRHLRFDIGLLAGRLVLAIDWLSGDPEVSGLPIGLFGSSTGAAAALYAAVERPDRVAAVVSRGGRPDLALPVMDRVRAPTLLLVGGEDHGVIELNEEAYDAITGAAAELSIVPGATHLFEEPGTLEEVARQTAGWFTRWLPAARERGVPPAPPT